MNVLMDGFQKSTKLFKTERSRFNANQEIDRLSEKINGFLESIELGKALPTSKDVF